MNGQHSKENSDQASLSFSRCIVSVRYSRSCSSDSDFEDSVCVEEGVKLVECSTDDKGTV